MNRSFLAAACLILAGETVHPTVSCPPPPPLCASAASADLVFLGEVLSVTDYVEQTERGPLPQGIQAIRFNVTRPFKAVTSGESWGLYYYGQGGESTPFKKGARYLVFAERRVTGAFVTGCTPTRELSSADEDEWSRSGAAQLQACFKRRERQ